jgi:hypothetical protein
VYDYDAEKWNKAKFNSCFNFTEYNWLAVIINQAQFVIWHNLSCWWNFGYRRHRFIGTRVYFYHFLEPVYPDPMFLTTTVFERWLLVKISAWWVMKQYDVALYMYTFCLLRSFHAIDQSQRSKLVLRVIASNFCVLSRNCVWLWCWKVMTD